MYAIFELTPPSAGYGGFTISINPFFSPSILTFLQRYGAVLAVPNIRGGGEFGEEWHLAGTKERKVNCFDDFIAARFVRGLYFFCLRVCGVRLLTKCLLASIS